MQRISNGNKMLLFCTFNNFQGNSNYFQGTDGFWDLINITFYDLTYCISLSKKNLDIYNLKKIFKLS